MCLLQIFDSTSPEILWPNPMMRIFAVFSYLSLGNHCHHCVSYQACSQQYRPKSASISL
ncbi:hypothetical protein BDR07DRAFT_1422987 [Suillus spraguei]|nr:hypothetical protein BDR07DRAFT_1422987 [Suillus spraguei]